MGLLDLLLPERCAGCGVEETAFCAPCAATLVRLEPPLCERCGAPVAWPVDRCRECAGRRLAFATARAAVAYTDAATRIVGAWKDGGRRSLARVAASLVAQVVPRPDVVAMAFVPAVADRGLWRGHNPAERLSLELGRVWSLPVEPLLIRAFAPRPQRGLALVERRRNVDGGFVAVPSPARVVLVDDVYTSGSTASAAATALRRSGAQRVDVVTFARAARGR